MIVDTAAAQRRRWAAEGINIPEMVKAIRKTGEIQKTGGIQPRHAVLDMTGDEMYSRLDQSYAYEWGGGDSINLDGNVILAKVLFLSRGGVRTLPDYEDYIKAALGRLKQGAVVTIDDGVVRSEWVLNGRVFTHRGGYSRYDAQQEEADVFLPPGIRHNVADALGLGLTEAFHSAFDRAVDLLYSSIS